MDIIFEGRSRSRRQMVSIYRVERHYGGPAEGGWWYESGELIRPILKKLSGQKLRDFRDKLQRRLDRRFNKSRGAYGDLNSALGDYEVRAIIHYDGDLEHNWPKYRPTYE